MAKVRINKLPKGYSFSNGKVLKSVKTGGFKTGDQHNFGLTTFPKNTSTESNNSEIPFFPSGGKVQNSLGPVDVDKANIEAEKNETVLTDLNNDGIFELYNVGGKRHNNGGTPLNLPDQSFIYSDTRSMKLNKDELTQLNVDNNKKLTPAEVSKKFQLNQYTEALNNPFSDKISTDTSEYMLDKNKRKLSHLAFIQEAKKDFEEGVPSAAFPYLKEKGIDPVQYAQMVDQINQKEIKAVKDLETPIADQEKFQTLNKFIQGSQQQNQMMAMQQMQNSMKQMKTGGSLPQAQDGTGEIDPWAEMFSDASRKYNRPYFTDEHGYTFQDDGSFINDATMDSLENVYGTVNPIFKSSTKWWENVNPDQQAELDKLKSDMTQSNLYPAAVDTLRKSGGSLPIAKEGTTITDFGTNWNSEGNKEVRQAFYDQYASKLNKEELSDDEKKAIDTLLIKDNKIKTLMHDTFEDDYFTTDDWDDGTNTKYNQAIEKLKTDAEWDGTGLTDDEIGQIQDAHIILDSMSRLPEYNDIMKKNNVSLNLTGPEEEGNVGEKSTLSARDNLAGDNFINTFVNTSYTTTPGDDNDEINLEVGDEYTPPEAKYWLQDNMLTSGAIMDKFNIKKHGPVLTQFHPDFVEPAYLSPTRQFAKIAELTAQAADTASTFAGPKRALSVMSKASGEAMNQLANVQADIDNKNQQIFGETEVRNTEIANKFEEKNKVALADFYDKTKLTEENYDAAMRDANQNILKQLVNRENNKWKTYNLNTLYPHFDVDPSTGGGIYNIDQDQFYAQQSGSQDDYDTIKRRVEQLVADKTITADQAHNLLKDHIGMNLPGSQKGTKTSPYSKTIQNMFNYPGYNQNSALQQQQLMMLMQQQQQQQNPYAQWGKRGTEVGYVPRFPFTIPRKKRKIKEIF